MIVFARHAHSEVGNTFNCQFVSSLGCRWTIRITIPFKDKRFVVSRNVQTGPVSNPASCSIR